jgi:hypothetical protein
MALALSLDDGGERWRFPVGDVYDGMTANGDLVFVTDVSPRWRNWLRAFGVY